MFHWPKRITHIITIATAAVFFMVGPAMLDMRDGDELNTVCEMAIANTHSSPSHASQTMCPMKVGEHLSWWNSAFTGIPSNNTILGLIAILGTLLVARLVRSVTEPYSLLSTGFTHRSKDPPDLQVRDYFVRFLADGKARPLLYA